MEELKNNWKEYNVKDRLSYGSFNNFKMYWIYLFGFVIFKYYCEGIKNYNIITQIFKRFLNENLVFKRNI